jgi:hypothetical protein
MSLRDKRYAVLALSCILFAFSAAGAADERHSVAVPGGPPLSFVRPADWSVETEEAGPSVTVRLTPTSGGDFLMLMTIFPFQPDSPVATPEGLRSAVLEVGKQQLPGAVQDSIELMEVRGNEVLGYLYHLTDRNQEQGPGDYREANQGMMLLTPYVASVTVLTHSDDIGTVERAFDLLKSLEVESSP